MDLADIKPKSDEIVVTLKHPATDEVIKNDDGTDMTITLHAPHTKEYRKAMYSASTERLKDKKDDLTPDDYESIGVEVLVRVTKTWNITWNEKKPKATPAKIKEVYSSSGAFWIINDLQSEVQGFEAFTPA